jgi:hypothetical protein
MGVKLVLSHREEHRSRMFKNGFLRRIFGHKRDEVSEDLRKFHNEKLHVLHSSTSIRIKSRRVRWAEHVARMWEMRNAFRILVSNPKGNRSLRRLRRSN